MILFTYVFSFGFARVQSNRDFFSVISMMVRQVASCIHITQFLFLSCGTNTVLFCNSTCGCWSLLKSWERFFITKWMTYVSGVCGIGLAGSAVICEWQPWTDQKPAQPLVFLQPSVPSYGLPQLYHQGRSSIRASSHFFQSVYLSAFIYNIFQII